MTDKAKEFKKELYSLLNKYNASIYTVKHEDGFPWDSTSINIDLGSYTIRFDSCIDITTKELKI